MVKNINEFAVTLVLLTKTQPETSFAVPTTVFSPVAIFNVPDCKSNPLFQFITVVPLVSLRFLPSQSNDALCLPILSYNVLVLESILGRSTLSTTLNEPVMSNEPVILALPVYGNVDPPLPPFKA